MDMQRINFALLYLRGSALEWFKPDILSQNPAATWMANFEEFESDLCANFSTFNPVGDAEDQLDNIIMKVTNISSNMLSHSIGWQDALVTMMWPSTVGSTMAFLGASKLGSWIWESPTCSWHSMPWLRPLTRITESMKQKSNANRTIQVSLQISLMTNPKLATPTTPWPSPLHLLTTC